MPPFAAIDIGTNSILLTIATYEEGTWNPIVEEAEITRIGAGVDHTRALSSEGIARTLSAIRKYADTIKAHNARLLGAIGTSALRDATNSSKFLQPAESILDRPIEIVSGPAEAQLVLEGVRTAFLECIPPGTIVFDVGGGSTEFIQVGSKAEAIRSTSLDVGTVRLTERFFAHDPPTSSEISSARTFGQRSAHRTDNSGI